MLHIVHTSTKVGYIIILTKCANYSDVLTERDQYQLSTLSHVINARAQGYQELSDWPEEAPDSSVRNVEVPKPAVESTRAKQRESQRSFYSSSGMRISALIVAFICDMFTSHAVHYVMRS